MPFTILGNQVSDVLQGAPITLVQMFETYPGSGQQGDASDVTIAITQAEGPTGGSGTPVAATPDGIASLSESVYQYVWSCPAGQWPGDYLVTWSGTVGGQAETYVQTVTVAAMPTGSPAPGVYASVSQYQAVTGDSATPDGIVQAMLGRASEAIDHYLIGAVYAVNANGMPTDPMLIDVLVRAVSRQCEYMLADNDPTGVRRQYTSLNVGGVTTARSPKMTALAFPPLAPQAAAILHTAGVLGSAALIAW